MPQGSPRTVVGEPVFRLRVRPDRHESQSGTATVMCRGELDLATGPMLLSCVQRQARAGRRTVRLEVSELRFCDARGLSVLLQAHRHMESVDGMLVLVNPRATLTRTLTLTGLDDVLHTIADVIPLPRLVRR